MNKNKVVGVVGAIAAVAAAAFVVVSVIKTGELPLEVEETRQIPAGGELVFADATGMGGLALKVKVDLSSMTNLNAHVPTEAETWLLLGAEPKQETNVPVAEVKEGSGHSSAQKAEGLTLSASAIAGVKHVGGGMKVYYSHAESTYNTEEEYRDVDTMGQLGLNVFNPNSPDVQERIQLLKDCGRENEIPEFLASLMDKCDGVVFKANLDGTLDSQVKADIQKAQGDRKPILQVPSLQAE